MVVPERVLVEVMVSGPLLVLALGSALALAMVDARGQRRGMAGRREFGPGLESRVIRREWRIVDED